MLENLVFGHCPLGVVHTARKTKKKKLTMNSLYVIFKKKITTKLFMT